MIGIKKRFLLKGILFFSFITLSVAYFIEHILGHLPCSLCLMQRVPYILAIIFIALIFFSKRFEKPVLLLLSVVFILGAILSIYHVGVEQNIFKEPFVCDIGDKSLGVTKEDLLRQLENNKISCKDVTFSVFGISLATINTIISIALSAIMIKNYINYEKN